VENSNFIQKLTAFLLRCQDRRILGISLRHCCSCGLF